MPELGPRIVITGTHSGVGKTTIATGVMAALTARGLQVASAKVGPDFIDPSYHALATGRPGCSLDAWLSGEDLIAPLAAEAGAGADILIVEGVMGMFDGSSEPDTDGSTAHIARLLGAPLVLVVDAWSMSGSVAAVVHGFVTLDPTVTVAGVVLNRVAGPGHDALLRAALAPLGIPVLGSVPADPALDWRERHLGLVPVAEQPARASAAVERLGEIIAVSCDLEALVRVAQACGRTTTQAVPEASPSGRARVAVAGGAAFSFTYPENLRALQQAGAELIPFDPVNDTALPEACDALYAGGGFPEAFAPALSANAPLLAGVAHALSTGMTTWAECGGLLWLCQSLDGAPMAGVLPARAEVTDHLTIGYRRAECQVASPFGPAGTELRGHEFHQSAVSPPGHALELRSRFGATRAGYATPTLFASYLHQHLAATPALAERFVAAAGAEFARRRRSGLG